MFKDKAAREIELIEKIHNEFDTAQDRLYEKAVDVLAELEIPTETKIEDKAKRLSKLGFTKTEDVEYSKHLIKKRSEIIRTVDVNEYLADLISEYKRIYPFQKFLTESELDRICAKYNLIHAPVGNYIKTVPERNLEAIEKAKPLMDAHLVRSYKTYTFNNSYSSDKGDYKKFFRMIGAKSETLTEYQMKHYIDKYVKSDWDKKYMKSKLSDFVWQMTNKNNNFNKGIFADCTITEIKREGLFIAAPKSHFDLKDLNKTTKFGFNQVFKTEIKDPIVFRYCKGGIQVLTMWGDENFDPNLEPSLHNPINN